MGAALPFTLHTYRNQKLKRSLRDGHLTSVSSGFAANPHIEDHVQGRPLDAWRVSRLQIDALLMLSWLNKRAAGNGKKNGSKEDGNNSVKAATLKNVQRDVEFKTKTPRLERSRNRRWHLTRIDSFDLSPKQCHESVQPRPRLPSLSEPVSPRRIRENPHSPFNATCDGGSQNAVQPSCDGYGDACDCSSSSAASSSPESDRDWDSSCRGECTASNFQHPKSSAPDNDGSNKTAYHPESFRKVCPLPMPKAERFRQEKQLVLPKPNHGALKLASTFDNGTSTTTGVPRTRRTPDDSGWVHPERAFGESPKRSPASSPSPHRTPRQSPMRSPLSSPKRSSVAPTPRSWQNDAHSQHAHPLPLPPSAHRISGSPTSASPSVAHSRFDDLPRVDPPSPSKSWPRSPGRTDLCHGKWIKGALLGSGSFGKVYQGINSENGDLCAIKEVELVPDDPRSKESANQLMQEIKLLSGLSHRNILLYKGSEMVGDSLYIYLELAYGSIYKFLGEVENGLPEPVIRSYTRQILEGLDYLHDKKTVHRDIKCANVLVGQDGTVKLADFGMAKLIGRETAPLSFKGSPYWMAPEVILQNNSGFELAVDIWSLGCTVIEMATGKPPWYQYEGYAAMFKVMNCHDVPIPVSLSRIGQDFVRSCLQRDPAKRPSASTLLCHPFVQLDNYYLPSNGGTLSQAVGERMRLQEHVIRTPRNITRQPFTYGESPNDSIHSKQRIAPKCFSGPVSPRSTFQPKMHTSQSDLLLCNMQQTLSDTHRMVQPVNEYVNMCYETNNMRVGAAFSSKRFTGKYEPHIGEHGREFVQRF